VRHTRRALELAAALLVATAVSDAIGLATLSFYLLVAAVPATAVAGLVCLARVVDERGSRVQALLLAGLIAAVVLGAAARSPALTEGAVPGAATAALGLGFVLLFAQAVLALVPRR
jgi:hypothetical protein